MGEGDGADKARLKMSMHLTHLLTVHSLSESSFSGRVIE